jgi:FkbM family methyltransferase
LRILFIHKFIRRLEQNLYGRKELQSLFESLHRLGLRGMGYMQSQHVEKTGEIGALTYAFEKHSENDSSYIFDVGANKGQFAVQALKVLPTDFFIHSFEPSIIAYNSLIRNVVSQRVKLHNFGLSDKKQTIKLFNSGELVGSVYPITGDDQSYEEVYLNTLDAFCEVNKIKSIYYLKIDVEGAEIDVLRGANRLINSHAIQFIQFEIGPNNLSSKTTFRDFFDILSDYSIFRILKNGIRKMPHYHEYLEIPLTSNFLAQLNN